MVDKEALKIVGPKTDDLKKLTVGYSSDMRVDSPSIKTIILGKNSDMKV